MSNHVKSKEKIKELINRGVKIQNPESIYIGDDVDINRISTDNVVIYPGCKLYGKSIFISKGARLGYESCVTVENCQIGPYAHLKGGFFKEAVFLKDAKMGSGAHVREGTIFEEQASGAHMVGLKQTILFPFVTLGSIINFCDCLMAGGTSRKNHSEVGSSYIHFNYTPGQDKATPSLLGDIPNGVMLNQEPIFLGGQGGLVGPCRIGFGNVITAGSIIRKDETRSGYLLKASNGRGGSFPYKQRGIYLSIKRIVLNNIIYIANLIALMEWYLWVRSQFVSKEFPQALLDGLTEKLNMGIEERKNKLMDLCQRIQNTLEGSKANDKKNSEPKVVLMQKQLFKKRFELYEALQVSRNEKDDDGLKDRFLDQISKSSKSGQDYIDVIKNLDDKSKNLGTMWLQDIVEQTTSNALKSIPLFID